MKRRLISVLVVCCVPMVACVSSAPTASPSLSSVQSPEFHEAQKKTGAAVSHEQAQFGAEDKIERPVPLPKDVLEILRRDERVSARLAEEDPPNDAFGAWFVASEIALNDDDLPDLLVQGVEPHILGANLVPWWVFHKTPKGHALALTVNTLGLEVLKTKTNGYRDIRTNKATAKEVLTNTYRFDGSTYRVQK
jgi:hypothetical protein